jgi:hypothetical protein
MWLQFCDQPWFHGRTGRHVTMLHFPSPDRGHLSTEQRVAELRQWWERSREPGFQAELDGLIEEQIRWRALDLKIQAMELKDRVAELERRHASPWLRTKRAVAALRPVEAFLARRRAGR